MEGVKYQERVNGIEFKPFTVETELKQGYT